MSTLARRLVGKHRPTITVTKTYATWNPADKGGGVVLSNGNLTVSLSTSPTDGGSVRSTIGKSSGKWYWECTLAGTSSDPGRSLPGVASSSASVASSNVYALSSTGYGYYTYNGLKYNNGGATSYGSSCAGGDVIGVALDMDAGTLTFYKNGVSLGVAYTGLTGVFYAADGNYTLNLPLQTTNFGATPFVYSPPAGYNAGLYNTSVAYTTWNPSDKSANITLSNGNLSLSTANPGGTVRSALAKSSGKWYWEVTRTGGADLAIGIAKASATLASYLGSDANGYSYVASNGNKITNGSSVAYGAACPIGTVIGIAMDLDAGTLTFYKNGVSQGVAFTGLSGTFFAAEGTTNNSDACTANFGATAFSYTPPAGFNAGLFA